MEDGYPGKGRRLVRRFEWMVTVSLLLIETPSVTFRGNRHQYLTNDPVILGSTSKEIEDEDEAVVVRFGEDGMDL